MKAKKSSLTISMFVFFAAVGLAEDASSTYESETLKGSYYGTEKDIDGDASLVVNSSSVCSQWASNSDLWILTGGGSDGVSVGGNTSLTINNSTVNDSQGNNQYTGFLYGGGANNSTVGGNSTLTISGGTTVSGLNSTRGSMFGGSGANSTVKGNSTVTISALGISDDNLKTSVIGTMICGGGAGAVFTRNGGTISETVNAGTLSIVKGDTTVNILDGAKIDYYNGAGSVAAAGYGNNIVEGNSYVKVVGSTTNCIIYNGGFTSYNFNTKIGTKIYGSSEVYIKDSAFKNVWGLGLIGCGNAVFDEDGNFVSVVDASKVVARLTIENSSSENTMGVIGDNNTAKNCYAYGSVEINVIGGKLGQTLSVVGIGGVAYGNAIVNISGGTTVKKIYGGACRGGTVYGDSIINIKDSTVGSDIYMGGMAKVNEAKAIHKGNSIITIEDSEIGGNVYAGGRGENTLIEGNATVTLIGNVHKKDNAVLGIVGVGDTDGASATVRGAVNGTKTLNLGTAGKAFAGTSALNVSYFDTVNVNAGSTVNFGTSLVLGGEAGACAAQTMNVSENAVITADNISIASAGTLSMTVGKADQIAGTVSNAGTLVLKASANLAGGTYRIASDGISGEGTISVFGGTYSDGNLTVAAAKAINIDMKGDAILLTGNGRAVLSKDGTEKIELAFNANNVSVERVSTKTAELTGAVSKNFTVAEAYDFGVTGLQDGESVAISFLVDNASLSVSDFTIYHKNDGDGANWEVANDVSNVSYDGKTLSFVVTHFSGYGYGAIPEPSAFGLLAGLGALALAGMRRRRIVR